MGVPDFLKFVARLSPAALCRIPKSEVAAAPLCFDFILIDATNAHQTIGLEALEKFLKQPQLKVKRAVIFAVDAQRHRGGTSRSQRTHATVLDADVYIQQLCCELQRYYKQQHQHQQQKGGNKELQPPQVLISGRNVAGEADYKILDIHRQLVTQALSSGMEIPSFCFISEDSDVLCGVLCGPAPNTVSIATKLHDTMFEVCILRLTHVLAYIAKCVDAINGEEVEETPTLPIMNNNQNNNNNNNNNVIPQEVNNETEKDGEIIRRKRQDGPMIATGTRVVLSDSDDDDDDDDNNNNTSIKQEISPLPVITPHHTAAAEILQNSCVDLVFLFVVVMGNGGNVPPIIRGVTKVDIQTCWKVYCRMKYNSTEAIGREKEMGRSLLCLHDIIERKEQQTHNIASVVIDCSFLRNILEAAHYADAQSRPPVEEEKERALLFLSQAVYSTLRYIIACNLNSDALHHNNYSFLDTRPLMETEVTVPSLAAFLWVLGQSKKKILYFPLGGLATEKVLLNAAKGLSAVEEAITNEQACSYHNDRNLILQNDVCNTLVVPGVSNNSRYNNNNYYNNNSRIIQLNNLFSKTSRNNRSGILFYINEYVEKHFKTNERNNANNSLSTRGTKSAIFSHLILIWQRTMTSYIPLLQNIIKENQFINSSTGTDIDNAVTPTPKSSSVKLNLNNNTSLDQSKNMKLSYSFELRRMAPLLSGGNNNNNNNKEESKKTNTPNEALLRALRVSYDYAKPTPPPASLVVFSKNSTEVENTSSLSKTQKKSKFNKDKLQDGKSITSSIKTSNIEGETDNTGDDKNMEEKPTKYRRLGKKEREKLKRKRSITEKA